MSLPSVAMRNPDAGNWRLMLAVAVLIGAARTLAAVDGKLKLLLLAGLAAPVLLFLFFEPRTTFFLWALLVPTQFFWTDDLRLLPSAFRYVDDLLLLLLLARVVADRIRKGLPFQRTPFDLALGCYLGLGVLSALVNRTPLENALLGIRAPIQVALVVYVIRNAPDIFPRGVLFRVLRPLLILSAVQILAAVYQYPRRGFGADSLTGTMGPGGANDLGVFLLPFLFYLLSLRFDAGYRRGVILLGIVSIFVAPILSGSRAGWFVALFAALLLWGRRLVRPRTLILASVVGGVLFAFVSWIVVLTGARSVESAIGPSGVLSALFLVSSGGGNLAYFPVVWRVVQAEAVIPLLGLGPGMVSSSAAVNLDAPLFRNILYDYFGQTRFGLDGAVESQILATAGEMGPLAFLALAWATVIWLRIAWESYGDLRRPPQERALAAGVFVAALAALALTPIRNVWETPHMSFSLWLPGLLLLAARDATAGERAQGPVGRSAPIGPVGQSPIL